MHANRFTALIDACALFGALKRNIILSLAEANLYRVRWTVEILNETELALARHFEARGDPRAVEKAKLSRGRMETAFPDAVVADYESLIEGMGAVPDPKDRHVVAAAVTTSASVIVTDNSKDFPAEALAPFGLDAKTVDEFVADAIDLDIGQAVAAVRRMRDRFERPEMSATELLLSMEGQGLLLSVDILREHIASL